MPNREHLVGRLSDLPPAPHLRPFDLGERKLLLVHSTAGVFVVNALCPHAQAPLAEGALCGNRLVCPWHHGVFDVSDGSLLEPPPLDNLPSYPVRIAGDDIFVELPEPTPVGQAEPPRAPAFVPTVKETIAIVGAGAAGQAAAERLRAEGFKGRLVLIGRETAPPYDRTLLTKHYLSGQAGEEKLPLRAAPDFYQQHGIERMVKTVRLLDATAKRITFTDATDLTYDSALLASGGIPKPLDVPGSELMGVQLLRTVEDAKHLIALAEGKGKHAVVIGANYIGMEAACCLAQRGLDVTVVGPQQEPLESPLGTEVGGAIRALHEANGVHFRMGEKVAWLEGVGGAVQRVWLKSGVSLSANLVVVGVGIKPATGFLRGVELAPDGGVVVNDQLLAGPDLYAAGDVAVFPLPNVFSEEHESVRIEHWRTAQQHAFRAARNLLDRRPVSLSDSGLVPLCWTFHFGQRLNQVGYAKDWDEVIFDGDPHHPPFIAYYVSNGKVRSAAGVWRDADLAALHELLRLDQMPPPEILRAGGFSPMAALARVGDNCPNAQNDAITGESTRKTDCCW